ncbi:MAG: FAD-binding oxidoreductase [Pseudonocardia sp.]
MTSTIRTTTALPTCPIVTPTDPDYDDARRAFNLTVDARPAAVARPRDVAEVVAAVAYADARGLRVAPQSTGHNLGAHADLGGSLLVDVRALQEVHIDAAQRRVRVGAGVRWEQVAPRLSDLGLAALHGSSPKVGIAGYSLGGGMGWLGRRYGLQGNAVTAIELVTADGRARRVDARREPDLFWALRGGGGNFGVVTAVEFRVFALPQLHAGTMFFPIERVAEVVHTWRRMLPALPDTLTTWVSQLHFPDIPEVPEPVRGGSFAVFYGVLAGDGVQGRRLLAPVRDLGPEIDTFADVAPSELGELAMDPPDPLPYLGVHLLLDELTAEAADTLLAAAGPDPMLSMVQLRHIDGALGRVAPGAGARATLPGTVCLDVAADLTDPAVAPAVRAALARIEAAMAPWRSGAYPNFVEKPSDASAFFDAPTWARLRAVKRAVDPGDLFHGNHHIPPA